MSIDIDLSNSPEATPEPPSEEARATEYQRSCPLCGELYLLYLKSPDPATAHRRAKHPGWGQIDEDSDRLNGGPYPGERA